MTRQFFISCALGLACIACLSAGGQAGPITFTYDWSKTTPSVSSDNLLNAIEFNPQGAVTVPTGAVVGSVGSISILNGTTDTFTNKSFDLIVKITDGSNSGTVSFNGLLNATVLNGGLTSYSLTYLDPTTQPLGVGSDNFTVSITGSIPPSPFGSDNLPGAIGFEITGTGGNGNEPPPPNVVPEPTSLLLSCIGAGLCALGVWRKRSM
jgi:hypothetical protein